MKVTRIFTRIFTHFYPGFATRIFFTQDFVYQNFITRVYYPDLRHSRYSTTRTSSPGFCYPDLRRQGLHSLLHHTVLHYSPDLRHPGLLHPDFAIRIVITRIFSHTLTRFFNYKIFIKESSSPGSSTRICATRILTSGFTSSRSLRKFYHSTTTHPGSTVRVYSPE